MTQHIRRGHRIVIGVIVVAWINISVGYGMLVRETDPPVSFPWLVSVCFGVSAMLNIAFILRPYDRLLYTLAGATSAVAIVSRALSNVHAVFDDDRQGAIFLTLSQLSLSAVLLVLFWWFWQVQIKIWHNGRKAQR